MNKILNFVKVKETEFQRFYKLSEPVDKVPNKNYNWEEEKKYNLLRLKDEFKKYYPELIEYVVVSDAHTHIERLVFLGIPINEEKTDFGCLCGFQLDGDNTMLIEGGDLNKVYPDNYYLQRLAEVNNYEFGFIK
jgi:hypothetical protein